MPPDKARRIQLASETLKILKQGHYTNSEGEKVRIGSFTGYSVENTLYYGPNLPEYASLIEVTNETTLQAAHALTKDHPRVGVLNFASGKNPGGGFIRGTQAQEESLARSSALYASLTKELCEQYYVAHAAVRNPLYSHRMIWTPACPIFRDDDGNLLPQDYWVDILTAAAPNVRALKETNRYDANEVTKILRERIGKILQIFDDQDCRVLVLGAWGCGVFGNHPNEVASIFSDYLCGGDPGPYPEADGRFYKRFDRVRFAIYGSTTNFKAFKTWLLD